MQMTVERVSYLYEEEVALFLNEIQHTFESSVPEDAQLIRQAAAYVRNQAVGPYIYSDTPREIQAVLHGPREEQTKLNFNTLTASCTCGQPGFCVHQIAVLFHIYSQFYSLSDWLQEWREIGRHQITLSIFDRTPDAWIDALSKLTAPLSELDWTENPGVFIHESNMIDQKMKPLAPFEYEWKPIFDLYYRLHVLEAAWPYVSEHLRGDASTFFYGKWHVKNWLSDQLGKLQDSVRAIGTKPTLFEADVFLERLQDIVRSFALNEPHLLAERFWVYRLFWQQLFVKNTARTAELEKLQQVQTEESRVFLALFYLLHNDEEALHSLLQLTSAREVAMWLPLADLAEDEEMDELLSVLLEALLPFFAEFVNQFPLPQTRTSMIRHLDGLLEIAGFQDTDRESLLMQYGSAGVEVYADFLIEADRFSEWGALMHRYRVTYEEAEDGGLKVALAEDPGAVLPLLHTFAVRFIQEKNRHSYRRAVKIFKKMKAGAKKSGKIDFWNNYVDTVREKHRRLRAFVEEMEKGNLHL